MSNPVAATEKCTKNIPTIRKCVVGNVFYSLSMTTDAVQNGRSAVVTATQVLCLGFIYHDIQHPENPALLFGRQIQQLPGNKTALLARSHIQYIG